MVSEHAIALCLGRYNSAFGRIYTLLMDWNDKRGGLPIHLHTHTIRDEAGVGSNIVCRAIRVFEKLGIYKLEQIGKSALGYVADQQTTLIAQVVASYRTVEQRNEAINHILAGNIPNDLVTFDTELSAEQHYLVTNGTAVVHKKNKNTYEGNRNDISTVEGIKNNSSSISFSVSGTSAVPDETNPSPSGDDMGFPKAKALPKAAEDKWKEHSMEAFVDAKLPLQQRQFMTNEQIKDKDYWLAICFMFDWNRMAEKYPKVPKIKEAKALFNGNGQNNTHVKNIRKYIAECGDLQCAAENLQELLNMIPKCPILLGQVFPDFVVTMSWLFQDVPERFIHGKGLQPAKDKSVYKVLSGDYLKKDNIGDNKEAPTPKEEIDRKKAASKAKYL